ncbi:similar to Saccharomyces cerevisiae YHR015W MIP6 Putative RNA-binding protein, interacts with Mex67p, which is a component of the nuclear pore involved in nuclear mRNA export [Maudiozyma saulgeensis]|uniref:Similar to Saccharomyces cerevisiae YHR015W MIP6 Putative RNA-binding protein, interacts with Mex67p, which is a component of the nuclear pore involved in nuclear mRNA export n=1 Tax=Maudiozyma saulgeensis TaxID=1789683 RepID=A0A1X7R037_9SACH|nr:similar to Saccharomyces cerevisiae YHR015W MIP6 Putative RNA-binding protein, interacts with Mex67p, which is a component of the nuclear pore involved in nuclear mRNA export [Kazachstania saulgeensis]
MKHFSPKPSVVLNDVSLEQINTVNNKKITTEMSREAVFTTNKENEGVVTQITDLSKGWKTKLVSEHKNKTKAPYAKKLAPKPNVSSKLITTPKPRLIALYIGGLGPSVTEDDIKKEFGKFKSLTSVKICYDTSTNQSLGYGYLNFKNQQDVDLCTEEYNYNILFGNEIKIMPSLRNSLYRKNIGTNVFFSNLPLGNEELTTRKFYDTFKAYGKILSCKLDNRKNIGFVYFSDDKAATKVIEDYNNKEYFGSTIVCGLHFDKELRNFPDFDKTKLNLDQNIILQDELSAVGSDDGSHTKVVEEKPLVHPNAIFIKNLPKETTSEELLEHFCKIGPIKSVYTSDGHEKFSSKWAFLTYKKLSDTQKAIELLNNSVFKNSQISVTKARPRRYNMDKLKTEYFVILSGMGTICTKEFLSRLCSQERLHFSKFKVTTYNQTQGTFSGILSIKTDDIQKKIINFLNGRLVGGCIIHARTPNSLSEITELKLKMESASRENSLERTKHMEETKALKTNYDPVNKVLPIQELSMSTKIDVEHSGQEMKEKSQYSYVKELLIRQVKKSMKFLQLLNVDDPKSVNTISGYIIEVFWCNNIYALQEFMSILKTNIQYEDILHKQITEALKSLGFLDNSAYNL